MSANADSTCEFASCRKACVHRKWSAVLSRRSESVLLLARRVSPLIFKNRVSRSPEPPGSIWLSTFSRNLSSIDRSRDRNFLGKTLNQKRAVASVPALFLANTIGTVPDGVSQLYANNDSLCWLSPGAGKLRKSVEPIRTPASCHEPEGVKTASSEPP